MSGLPPPSYPGYPPAPVSGNVNTGSQPGAHPQFQTPRASPSHPSQMGAMRGSPSHPSQLSGVRSSPSHSSFARSPSHHSSPSHPSQLPPTVRSSPSHPSQIATQMQTPNTDDELSKLRFQVELEFVQCLANPNYLNFLAQRGYMKDPCFVNYLAYLQYWKEPAYVNFIKYPICLYFLELLQHETFRKEIVSGQCVRFLDDQVILHWQHYTRRRTKLFEAASSNQTQSGAQTPASVK